MKHLFIIVLITLALTTSGQTIKSFDGRWCFTGSRTSIFVVKENQLFLTFIKGHDTEYFSRFYSGKDLGDSLDFFPVTVDSAGNKIFLSTHITINNRGTSLFLVFDKTVDSILNFVGDVYYDSSQVKFANNNCNLDVPSCTNYFYHRTDIIRISKLRDIKALSRTEAFNIFTQFAKISRNKCNKCYEGFPGADFNQIVINMGFNPIYQRKFNDEMIYETSAFDFIRENMIGNSSPPKDQDLYDYYKKVWDEYWKR